MPKSEVRELPQSAAARRQLGKEDRRVGQSVDFRDRRRAQDQRLPANRSQCRKQIERAGVMVENAGAKDDVDGADRA